MKGILLLIGVTLWLALAFHAIEPVDREHVVTLRHRVVPALSEERLIRVTVYEPALRPWPAQSQGENVGTRVMLYALSALSLIVLVGIFIASFMARRDYRRYVQEKETDRKGEAVSRTNGIP